MPQPTSGPAELRGGPGATLCCCFSSSICCREKKGRRRDGGSSGWRLPHSSKLLACRHRTCRRRFFLWRVLKWQYSQAKGFAPVSTGKCLHPHSPPGGHLWPQGSLAASRYHAWTNTTAHSGGSEQKGPGLLPYSAFLRDHSQGHLPTIE